MEELPFGNNSRTLFKYEPFSYIYYSPVPIQSVTTSPNLTPYVTRVDPSAVIIAAINGYQGVAPSTETVVVDQGGDFGSSTQSFTFNPGRFFDSNVISFNNRTFTFFNREAIAPILFDSCINLASIQTSPTLPAGLQFVRDSSTGFLLSGTPLVQIPTSNYLVIGTGVNPAQVVTTTVPGEARPNGGVNIGVNAERLQLQISGATTISPMIVNTPISTRTITSIVGNPSTTTVQYTWGTLPSGIQFSNDLGIPYFGNVATIAGSNDPLFTLLMDGTPSLETAKSFARAGIVDYTIPLNAFRAIPLPVLSNTSNFTFRFEPMVLFDDFSNPTLFKDISVNETSSYRAHTYFTTDASITSMVQSGFPSGIDVSFVFAQQRAYLVGTPTVAGSFSATLFASTGSLTGSNDITVTVQDDVVTFQPPTATSDVSFIVSRPLSLFKPGYYASNIEFKAVAASGCNVTYSVAGLNGTGIETTVSNNILRLTGIPSTVTLPTTLTVTASQGSATNSASIQYEVRNDTITFANVPFSNRQFVQNREITPIQFSATTLSDRPVINYSGSNLPTNIRVSPTGLLTGTVTQSVDGSFAIVGSTGYVSASIDLSYTVIPDTMILISPVSSLSIVPSQQIGPVTLIGLSSSGKVVTNYQFVGLSPTYGLAMNSTNGVLNGTLTQGFPPQDILPASSNFSAKAFVGDLSASLNITLTTSNTFVYRGFTTHQQFDPSGQGVTAAIYLTDNFSNWSSLQSIGAVSFVDISYTSPFSNQITYLQNSVTTLIPDPIDDPYTAFTLSSTNKYTTGPTFTGGASITDFPGASDGPGIVYPDISPAPMLTAISIDKSTDTWWGVGGRVRMRDVVSRVGFPTDPIRWFAGNVLQSTDRGVNWSNVAVLPTDSSLSTVFYARDVGDYRTSSNVTYGDYYRDVGIAFAYKNGVMMVGGQQQIRESQTSNVNYGTTTPMIRSSNTGTTWDAVTGGFGREVAYFSTDNSSIWIATGSDRYKSGLITTNPITITNTIKYSIDEGLTWSNANGAFTGIGYNITYANNTWITTGIDLCGAGITEPSLRFSTDGSNWSRFDVSTSSLVDPAANSIQGPETYSPASFDGNQWYIFANRYVSTADFRPTLYVHDSSTSLLSNWRVIDVAFPAFPNGTARRDSGFYGLTPINLVSIGSPPNQPCRLTFSNSIGNGPTFASPSSSNALFYQYLPITPIQFAATGNGSVSYFLDGADLPRGLLFDPVTVTITGVPLELGDDSITIYAKDNIGITAFTLRTTTLIPRIIKQQTSAGAYTSLVRQYTEVNGAQNSINNIVYPTQEQKMGEFAAPNAPDTTKYSFDPCCDPTRPASSP